MKIYHKLIKGTFTGIVASLILTACVDNQEDVDINTKVIPFDAQRIENPANITENIISNPNLSIFAAVLGRLENQPRSTNKVLSKFAVDTLTVFAPSNAAFEELFVKSGISDISQIPIDQLSSLVSLHQLERGRNDRDPLRLENLNNSFFNSGLPSKLITRPKRRGNVTIFSNFSGNIINGVETPNSLIETTNGNLYVVEKLIQTPTVFGHIVNNPDFSTFVDIVNILDSKGILFNDGSGVNRTLTSYLQDINFPKTVFVPTNDAFAKWLKELKAEDASINSFEDVNSTALLNVVLSHIMSNNDQYDTRMPGAVNRRNTALSYPVLNEDGEIDIVNILMYIRRSGNNIDVTLSNENGSNNTSRRAVVTNINGITSNLHSTSGVVHTLEEVLLPPVLVPEPVTIPIPTEEEL